MHDQFKPACGAEFRTLGPLATGGGKQPTFRTAHSATPQMCMRACMCVCAKIRIPFMLQLRGSTSLHSYRYSHHGFHIQPCRGAAHVGLSLALCARPVCVCVCVCVCVRHPRHFNSLCKVHSCRVRGPSQCLPHCINFWVDFWTGPAATSSIGQQGGTGGKVLWRPSTPFQVYVLG